MADISKLAQLTSGFVRNIDLEANTPVVLSVKIGGAVNTELTKTILDKLVNLQNGTDFSSGTNSHTHNGLYFTETEIGSSTSSSGSDLVGDDATYSNFTPAAATVKGALSGIDTALGAISGTQAKVSATDTTAGYLGAKIQVDTGSNTTNALEESILNPAGNEILRVRFDQSKVDHGSITGLGDDDHTIYTKADGTRAFSGNQSMGSNKLTNVASPTVSTDAATKSYVDGLLDGRKWKQSVRLATDAALDVYTGTGTLTAVANGALSIDGVAVALNDRILVKDETSGDAPRNGIYVVDHAGSAGTQWILTRSTDADTAAELVAASVFVEVGTANADKQYSQTADSITLETTNIAWALTSANSFSGHDMIALSGGAISVDLATTSGLESSNPGNAAGQLRVKLEASNPSLQIDGSNQLGAKLDAAGTITKGASGLTVGTDDTTIEKNTNALRVKALGIGTSHIAADAVDKTKINADVAGSGLSQAGGGELDVAFSPLVKKTVTVGESFAANTTFAVRWAMNGETAGRVYKADKDASSTNKFYVVGLVMSTSALSAGDPTTMICLGSHTQGSSDTAFNAADIGLPVFLTAAGAWSITAPSATNEAVTRIGMVETTTKIHVDPNPVYVN